MIYRNARKGVLEQLDVLYHAAIRLITNAPYRTHHCELYSLLNWTSLHIDGKLTGIFLFTKFGLLPEYLQKLLKPHSNTYTTRSSIIFPWLFLERKLLMVVPLLNLLPQMIGIYYKVIEIRDNIPVCALKKISRPVNV